MPQESISGYIKREVTSLVTSRLLHWLLHGYYTGWFTVYLSDWKMPGVASKQSRELANVRLQLKSGKTRGTNPRPLTPDELRALEVRREQLVSTVGARRLLTVVGRVNAHTSQEAEQTRDTIIAELRPLTSLVGGDCADSREERIKARNNQIALLQAANREDREAIRKDRVAAREANAVAKAAARSEKRRRTSSASGSTRAPSTPDQLGFDDTLSDDEPDAGRPESTEQDCLVLAKVDQLMAAIDARRGHM